MSLKPVASLQFVDARSGDQLYVGIRADEGGVSVMLSLKANGDMEVNLKPDECEQLARALQEALAIAKGQ